jgi:hypothetical protein
MIATAEITNLAEQRELRRINSAVIDARKRVDLTHMRRASGVIDATESEAQMAALLAEFAKLKSDLDEAILKWPSHTENENVSKVG